MRVPFAFLAPGGGGGPAFDPLSVGTPLVWYDLGVCTQGAGIVTALPDQSGNAFDATFDGGDEPAYTASNASFSNLPTMDFASSDTKHVRVPDVGITTGAWTAVLVASADGASSKYMLTSELDVVRLWSDASNALMISEDSGFTALSGGTSSSSADVIVAVYNGASSKLYTSAHTAATGDAGNSDLTGRTYVLGNYGASILGALSQSGSTAHFLMYAGALSQADVEYLLDGFGALAGVTIGP